MTNVTQLLYVTHKNMKGKEAYDCNITCPFAFETAVITDLLYCFCHFMLKITSPIFLIHSESNNEQYVKKEPLIQASSPMRILPIRQYRRESLSEGSLLYCLQNKNVILNHFKPEEMSY